MSRYADSKIPELDQHVDNIENRMGWVEAKVRELKRTDDEIKEAQDIDIKNLKQPESDETRVIDPRYLVMVGVCTHLGCVPLGQQGDYDGWFCPCHGSHYDTSGRIRKGPAPFNLEIPPYEFIGDSKIKIG